MEPANVECILYTVLHAACQHPTHNGNHCARINTFVVAEKKATKNTQKNQNLRAARQSFAMCLCDNQDE